MEKTFRRSHGVTSIALPRKRRESGAWRGGTRNTHAQGGQTESDTRRETERHWAQTALSSANTLCAIKHESQACLNSSNSIPTYRPFESFLFRHDHHHRHHLSSFLSPLPPRRRRRRPPPAPVTLPAFASCLVVLVPRKCSFQ